MKPTVSRRLSRTGNVMDDTNSLIVLIFARLVAKESILVRRAPISREKL